MAPSFPKAVSWPLAAKYREIASAPAIACCVKTETTAWPLGLLPSHPETARTPINHGTWRACALRQKKIKRPRLLKGPQFIANPPLHLAGLASSDCPPPFENGMVLASEPTSTDGFSP